VRLIADLGLTVSAFTAGVAQSVLPYAQKGNGRVEAERSRQFIAASRQRGRGSVSAVTLRYFCERNGCGWTIATAGR
jgi:hypothetical protein